MRRPRDHLAAGDVDVAGDGPQANDGVRHRGAIGAHIHRHAPMHGSLLGAREIAGGGDDLFGRHVGDGGNAVRRILGGARRHLVEAAHPAFDEILVVQFFADDHMQHAERQRAIGAGAELQMVPGAAGDPVAARLHGDDIRAALHAVHDPVAEEPVGATLGRVLAPEQDHLWRRPCGIIVAAFEELRAIGHREIAHHRLHGADARRVAGLPGQAELRPVGAAETVAEEGDRAANVAPGALREHHRLGAVLVADRAQPLFADVEGFVPGNRFERPLAARADAFQRAGDAVRVIHVLRHGQDARAGAPLRPGMRLVALDAHHAAILDEQLLPAPAMAAWPGGPGGGVEHAGFVHARVLPERDCLLAKHEPVRSSPA